MERLIAEVRAAYRANLFTLSLQGCLVLVDICGALESSDGRSTGLRFKQWFETNVVPSGTFVTPEDAWLLRCGMLHQGRSSSSAYKSIVFSLPDGRNNTFHNLVFREILNVDLGHFIEEVLGAASVWWASNQAIGPVAGNAVMLVRIRNDGMSPVIMPGVPYLG
jgi:hypothetical protein